MNALVLDGRAANDPEQRARRASKAAHPYLQRQHRTGLGVLSVVDFLHPTFSELVLFAAAHVQASPRGDEGDVRDVQACELAGPEGAREADRDECAVAVLAR